MKYTIFKIENRYILFSHKMDEVSFSEYPVRCITCGNVIGKYQAHVEEMLQKGHSFGDIFSYLKIPVRQCCRMYMMTPVERYYPADETLTVNRIDPVTKEAVFDLSALIRDKDGNVLDDISSFKDISDNPYTSSKPRVYSSTTLQLVNFKYWQELSSMDEGFYDVPKHVEKSVTIKNIDKSKVASVSKKNVKRKK